MKKMKVLLATAAACTLLASSALAEPKLGFINLQRAMNEVEEGKRAKSELKKIFDKKKKELQGKEAQVKKLKAELEGQALMMKEEHLRAKQGEFQQMAVELQTLLLKHQKEMSEKEAEAMNTILVKMNEVIQEIGKKDGFTMVLNEAAVVFAPQHLDITNEVIREYDSRFDKSGKRKGKGKKKK